jgi:tripartite-type tricarboxylate transporter receptor subunit TctC
VPYKGGGPAAAAILAGEVQLMFGSPSMTMPQVRAGRLRALATTGPKRSPVVPGVPTLDESGFRGFNVTSWIGLLVPAKTAGTVVNRLHREVVAALRLPDVQDAMARQGLEITTNSPAQCAEQIRTETRIWAEVVRTAGIHAE